MKNSMDLFTVAFNSNGDKNLLGHWCTARIAGA